MEAFLSSNGVQYEHHNLAADERLAAFPDVPTVKEAIDVDLAGGTWRDSLHAPDTVVGHMGAAIVGGRHAEAIRSGRPLPQGLPIPSSKPSQHCRVYGTDGRFLAMMAFDTSLGQWQPRKVFSISY